MGSVAAFAAMGPDLTFGDLEGWADDDATAAFACFRASAQAIVARSCDLRPALPPPESLVAVARAALALQPWPSQATARAFFERCFRPVLVGNPAQAFFTGYYEPVVEGALARSAEFDAPILARPPDLRTLTAGEPRPAALEGFSAARVARDGALAPYPDRAAIEAAVDRGGTFEPLLWLRDRVEVFLVHVQGSARVRLRDGATLRLTYAGRNGHPYTSIGRLLVEQGAIAPDAMSLAALKGWLREKGQAPGEPGHDVMARNASYIFFEAAPELSAAGPTGGEGLPLTALRSIAVDRSLWCYGLPFWIDADLPWRKTPSPPLRRLMIAQDTGSGITGPARADIFLGSGDAAGHLAGGVRHRGTFVVLRPIHPEAAP